MIQPEDIYILIGCEESQAICKALRALGFQAFSCDIKPCSGGHPEWHLQMDVFDAIKLRHWHAAIFHPDCTFVANSSATLYDIKKYGQKALDRMVKREQAILFFEKLIAKTKHIKFVAFENPVPSSILTDRIGKYNQIIQPFYYGDPFSKKTCLWVRGYPLLTHEVSSYAEKGNFTQDRGRTNADWYYRLKSGSDRKTIRSKTFPGIAQAVAKQWGGYVLAHEQILDLLYIL